MLVKSQAFYAIEGIAESRLLIEHRNLPCKASSRAPQWDCNDGFDLQYSALKVPRIEYSVGLYSGEYGGKKIKICEYFFAIVYKISFLWNAALSIMMTHFWGNCFNRIKPELAQFEHGVYRWYSDYNYLSCKSESSVSTTELQRWIRLEKASSYRTSIAFRA